MTQLPRRLRLDFYQGALLAAMALYAAVFASLAFWLHAAMRTHRADLGQIAQAVWNSSRGRFVEQTDNGFIATRLTDHVEPILSLISPVLWVWEDARALLLLQVLLAAAGAWPLYHLALRRLDRALDPGERAQIWRYEPLRQLTRPLALALAVAYLLAPQLQSALLTEFHAAPLAVPLILWALWAVDARRWAQFGASALLVASSKEEMALLAFLLGLWAAWQAWRQARGGEGPARDGLLVGTGVALLSLAWFALATFVIVPRHAAELYGIAESGYFARYGALGDSPLDIVRSLLTRPALVWSILVEPARLIYLRNLLAAFAFLPLLAPELLLLSLPLLLANTLSAYPAQYYGEFHYSAPLIPYFAAAAAYGLGRLWRWIWRRTDAASPAFQQMPAAGAATMAAASFVRNPRTTLRPLLAGALVAWIVGWGVWGYVQAGRGPGGGRFDLVQATAHHALLGRFLAQIPSDAAVTATAAVHPHVAMRRYVYQFPLGLEIPAGKAGEPATWALLDVTTNTDLAPGDLKAQVDALLDSGWGVVDAEHGFLLLAQGAGDSSIPGPFYDFARAEENAADRVLVDDWPRWRQTRLRALWPPGAASQPELALLAPGSEVIATLATAAPPALVWQPAESWKQGEGHRVTTLPLWLPRSAAVAVDGAIEMVLHRRRDGELVSLAVAALASSDYAQALGELGVDFELSTEAEFRPEGSAPLRLTAYRDKRIPWPGDTVDAWLQWQGEAWPTGYVPFIHLRASGVTVAQQDGMPLLFGPTDSPAALAQNGYANDWRQLQIPVQPPAGEWTLVAGLYDPVTGQRAPLAGGGDEVTIARFSLRRAVPDQACALNPQACASQPAPYR